MSTEGDLTGTCLRGKWTLESKLGEGGMAVVYAATHHSGHQRAAIKVLRAHFAADPDIRKRFQREGRAAQSLNHPGAVRIVDDDETEDGLAFLVMELLEGETWKAAAARSGKRLPVTDVLTTGVAILDILEAAHEAGVVHRDIKPENVFLTSSGEVKLLDFGIARVFESASERTQTGAMLGTPAYMSPEQALAKWSQVDHRSDLFSLGASMRSLLAGVSLHSASNGSEALVLAATRQARPLSEVATNAPPALAEFIDRAVSFDKEDRFESAASMRAEILRLLEREELPAVLDTTTVSPKAESVRLSGTAATVAAGSDSAVTKKPSSSRTGPSAVAATGTLVSASDAKAAPPQRSARRLWMFLPPVLALAGFGAWRLTAPSDSPTGLLSVPSFTVDATPTPTASALPAPKDSAPLPESSGLDAQPKLTPRPSAPGSSVNVRKAPRAVAEASANRYKEFLEKNAKGCNVTDTVTIRIRVTNDGRWHGNLVMSGGRTVRPGDGCVLGVFNTATAAFDGAEFFMTAVVTP